ncbi:SGNH/GDSL hydrolase family protein [Corallococcus sp. BB11-1]|uniref:SGNH/GDSL hydrolase family protein n=1 Tax=Corallococcus sp. BB11-1 TaxID=2996783 RepID=UPI0022701435|nr:SGNH/GDSL hydrolase family protein [Corallococcus sp. BB11-1]MCY1032716.1 SGNH/GDSL hydrolase family protein [Corallococcus sp. BB11-1]
MTNQVWGWLGVALLGLLGCGSKLEGESLEAWGTEEAGVAALAPKKVMPLGDSITQGAAGRASYRCQLWRKLTSRGYRADFVGTLTTGYLGENTCTSVWFDRDHEGHWSWRTDQVLANISAWAASTRPDLVLIHLGTNDTYHHQTEDSTVSELEQIIDRLRVVNPRVKVFLAQIIPTSSVLASLKLQSLNQRLPWLAAAKSTEDSPVYVVDQWTGFTPSTDTYDGVHPNLRGEEKMAERWYQAIRDHL